MGGGGVLEIDFRVEVIDDNTVYRRKSDILPVADAFDDSKTIIIIIIIIIIRLVILINIRAYLLFFLAF